MKKKLLDIEASQLRRELEAAMKEEGEEKAFAASISKPKPFSSVTRTLFSKSKVFNEVFTYREPKADLTERFFGSTL